MSRRRELIPGRYATTATLGAIVAVIVVVDQVTKWWVHRTMALHESVPIVDGFFNLTYVRNVGAAFGLFGDLPAAIRLPLLLLVSVGAIVLLVLLLRSLGPDQPGLRLALSAVVGGAIGNLIDRVRAGEVVDFFDVYWGQYHWPAFNVADSCISVGVVVMLILSFRQRADPPPPS